MGAGSQLIQPLVVLVVWSLIMWLWMYATRLPAIAALKMEMDSELPSGVQMSQLPAKVRWKADNYNHLMEEPTLFYALVLALVALGAVSTTAIYAAWGYVVLRVIHSLIQALGNKIPFRFVVFVLSNIPLIILAYITACAAFQ